MQDIELIVYYNFINTLTKQKMPSINLKIFLKVFIDFMLLIAVGLPILLFYLIGDPYKRGFFCTDESIRYPYKESTVTSAALYIFGTIIPLFFITLIEYLNIRKNETASLGKEKVRKWMWSLYHYFGIFLFGCALSHLTVDICKYSIGRLRPHFISVCNPDWSQVNCEQEWAYTTEDVCLNTDDRMREARLSFISGHSSFSAYTMFYLIFYLQCRLNLLNWHLVRPVLQYLCFAVAVFTTLSRVSDYKHHWSDVLAGFINGLAFAVFCAYWVADLRPTRSQMKHSDEIRLAEMNNHDTHEP